MYVHVPVPPHLTMPRESRSGLDALLEKFEPEQEVKVTISRRGRLRELKATLAEKPEKLWTLSESKERTGLQSLRYQQWLAESDEL